MMALRLLVRVFVIEPGGRFSQIFYVVTTPYYRLATLTAGTLPAILQAMSSSS